MSLADAPVVVSGGRGVGSAEGFAALEELAGLLGGVVGCSRAVTMAGWRPHTDQVGQTGTKISPEIYIPCGISGATQHMAGCKGAKKILAINNDPEAPILAGADYAVIGDLSEIVPAITAELRRVRGADGRDARERGSRSPPRSPWPATLFARRARLLVRLLRMGKPPGIARGDAVPDRVRQEAVVVLGQRKLLQRALPGVMHALIFWGFIVLFPTIVMAMIADRRPRGDAAVARRAGVVRAAVRRLRRAGPRRGGDGAVDPQGRAPRALRGQPPRRGGPDPRADQRDRHHAAAVARVAHRARAQRVRRRRRRRWRTCSPACSATAPSPRCSSACSCGRTCCSSSASSPTSRAPSTCTSSARRSTSTSGARARGGGSSRCGSTTRPPRRTCASASGPSRTSPGSR